MYIRERFISIDKKIIVQKKHHNLFAMPTKEKIRQKRLPKKNETDVTQEKINERIRREKYMRLLADNFRAGDFYITFTTSEKMTAEDFKESVRRFMKRLRREYQKRTGEKIKFFRALENLIGRGRPHMHMILPNFCDAAEVRPLFRKLWPEGHVRVEIYGGAAKDAHGIANYFCKQDKKEHGAKIDTSRGNLIRREPKREIVHAETFSDEIKAPAGYYVVKSLSYHTVTAAGYDYQIAVFEKIEGSHSEDEQ
jgi:hypothetical protein